MKKDIQKIEFTYDELRYLLAILSQGSILGLFRGLEQKPAIELYNKIYQMLEEMKKNQ